MTTGGNGVIADGWITTAEAVALTGYHIKHVRKLARDGVIEARKVTPRAWLLNRDSLLRYKMEMETLGDRRHSPRRNPLWLEGKQGRAGASE